MRKVSAIIAAFVLIGLVSGRADAGLIVNIHDNFSTVTYTLSGNILSPPLGTESSTNVAAPSTGSINPSGGSVLILGDTALYDVYQVSIFGLIGAFGSGGLQTTTGTSSGDLFGFFPSGSTAEIWLPAGYVGGNPLSATGEWNGSLASLGLSLGTFHTSIDSSSVPLGLGSITFNVTQAPEPGSVIILGLTAVAFLRRRRRHRS